MIARFAARGLPAKSGLMLGFGETAPQVRAALRDLVGAGCTRLTLGQYLRPSRNCAPVARYLEPAEFAAWETEARAMG